MFAVARHYYHMCLELWRYTCQTEERRPASQEFEVMRKGYKKTIPFAKNVYPHVFQGLAKRASEATTFTYAERHLERVTKQDYEALAQLYARFFLSFSPLEAK